MKIGVRRSNDPGAAHRHHPEPYVLNPLIVLCHAGNPYGAVQQAFRVRQILVGGIDDGDNGPVALGPDPVFQDVVGDIARRVFGKHVHGNQADLFIAVNNLGIIIGIIRVKFVIEVRECKIGYARGGACHSHDRLGNTQYVSIRAGCIRFGSVNSRTAGFCFLHIFSGSTVGKEVACPRHHDLPGKSSLINLYKGRGVVRYPGRFAARAAGVTPLFIGCKRRRGREAGPVRAVIAVDHIVGHPLYLVAVVRDIAPDVHPSGYGVIGIIAFYLRRSRNNNGWGGIGVAAAFVTERIVFFLNKNRGRVVQGKCL